MGKAPEATCHSRESGNPVFPFYTNAKSIWKAYEIYFDTSEGYIKAYTFLPVKEEIIKPAGMEGAHLGGDKAIMDSFVDAICTGKKDLITSVAMSIDSHLMAFAAEKARLDNSVIDINEFENENRTRT